MVGNSVAVSHESKRGTALSGFLECLDEDEVQDQILVRYLIRLSELEY